MTNTPLPVYVKIKRPALIMGSSSKQDSNIMVATLTPTQLISLYVNGFIAKLYALMGALLRHPKNILIFGIPQAGGG